MGDLTYTDNWENLKVKLKTSAPETCGFSKGNKKIETRWWTSELEALVKAKRDAWKNWTATRSMETSSYVEARNYLKTAVREATRAAAKKAFKEADDKRNFAFEKQRAKEQEDIVGSNCLRGPDDNVHMSLQEEKNIWKRHFNETMKEENENMTDYLPATHGSCLEFSSKEVKDAFDSVNSFKAAGPSGVSAAMLKAAGEDSIRVLRTMTNDLLCGTLPEDLKHSLVILLYYGKGDPIDRNSFWGKKVLEHSNVLEKLIECRRRQEIHMDNSQFSFIPGKGS